MLLSRITFLYIIESLIVTVHGFSMHYATLEAFEYIFFSTVNRELITVNDYSDFCT